MDLFVTSYLPTSAPLETFIYLTSSGSSHLFHQDQDSSIPSSHKPKLIKFLQHAIALGLDIIPPPALDDQYATARGGGTASVAQTFVDADTTLLYKRFRRDVPPDYAARYGDQAEHRFRDVQFTAMMNEMTILSHPALVGPGTGVVQLMGVCFELSSSVEHGPIDAEKAWPVLVLLKANRTDLAAFVWQLAYMFITDSPESLLELCYWIARSVRHVHQYGVVHCDINPRNILLYLDPHDEPGVIDRPDHPFTVTQPGAVVMADFGFSRYGADDDLIRLPRSEPWDAPEWHDREFTLEAARRADVYAFGLVCFWLWFRDDDLSHLGFPEFTIRDAFLNGRADVIAALQGKKRNKTAAMVEWSLELLAAKKDLQGRIRFQMERLFTMALAQDPASRTSDIQSLLSILAPEGPEGVSEGFGEDRHEQGRQTSDASQPRSFSIPAPVAGLALPEKVMTPEWHTGLEDPTLVFMMDRCDYRVQNLVISSLRYIVDNDVGCDRCKKAAAFQLSLFHRLGLSPGSSDAAQAWLFASGSTDAAIDDTIQALRASQDENELLARLLRRGHRADLPAQYLRDGVQGEAKKHYHRVYAARSRVLGRRHFSTLVNHLTLTEILLSENEYEEAWEMAKDVMAIDEATPSQHAAIESTLARLRTIIDDTEMTVAEPVPGTLPRYGDDPGEPEVSERLECDLYLVNDLLENGGGEEGEVLLLALKTAEACLAEFGHGHIMTASGRRCLAWAYDAEGQYEKAVETSELLIRSYDRTGKNTAEKSEQVDEPRVLVHDLASLGVRYYVLGRREEALSHYERVRALIDSNGGDADLAASAVEAVNNFALLLTRRGDLETATAILEALFPAASALLQDVHGSVIARVMCNLAQVYGKQEDRQKAEALERKVVDIMSAELGVDHRQTAIAKANLMFTLLALGKKDEAAGLARHEAERIRILPSSQEQTRWLCAVASRFEEAGAFAEALSLLCPEIEAELARRVPESVGISGDLASLMTVASICYVQAGDLSGARGMIRRFVSRLWKTETDAETRDSLSRDVLRLADLCLERQYYEERKHVLSGWAGLTR